MQNLFAFIYKFRVGLLFVLLEIACFWMIFRYNRYQNALVFNTSKSWRAKILKTSQSVKDYFHLEQVNEHLARENALLRKRLDEKNQKVYYPEEDSTFVNRYTFIPAKVADLTMHAANNTVTLEKGKKDGIEPGMGVLSPLGVVGKVSMVSDHYATVISILSAQLLVSSKIKKSNYLGSLKWDGKNEKTAKLEHIPKPINVRPGDTVVTTGFNDVFPEGIDIGIIKNIQEKKGETFHDIDVELLTDFKTLSYVYVVKNKLSAELDSLKNEVYP